MKKKELLDRIEKLEKALQSLLIAQNYKGLKDAFLNNKDKPILEPFNIIDDIKEEPETFMGFEVREYNGEVVEVRDDDDENWQTDRLIEIRKDSYNRVIGEFNVYTQVRRVPKDKQNFA